MQILRNTIQKGNCNRSCARAVFNAFHFGETFPWDLKFQRSEIVHLWLKIKVTELNGTKGIIIPATLSSGDEMKESVRDITHFATVQAAKNAKEVNSHKFLMTEKDGRVSFTVGTTQWRMSLSATYGMISRLRSILISRSLFTTLFKWFVFVEDCVVGRKHRQ